MAEAKPREGAVANRDIVVVGASAGGVEALSRLMPELPVDLPAAVFVVVHISPHGTSVLPKILSRYGPLPATHADEGMAIEAGKVYVAPPGRHLLLKRGRMALPHGPRENGARPAVDPLFRTAARAYGPRVVGVILSGAGDDGTAGLGEIKRRGGVTVAADPDEVTFGDMARNAIENLVVDHIASLSEIGGLVARLVKEPIEEVTASMAEEELDSTETDPSLEGRQMPGVVSSFTCPECGGALWEMEEGNLSRFRCRVGHAYSPESLLSEQGTALENALWAALRSLEETAALLGRLAERMKRHGNAMTAARFEAQAREARERAAVVRRALLNREIVPEPRTGLEADQASRQAEA